MITRQRMSEQGVKDVYRDVKTRMLELFKTLLGLTHCPSGMISCQRIGMTILI